jgi:thioredoxin reductase (NADPH)
MTEILITASITMVFLSIWMGVYLRGLKKREERARESAEKGQLRSDGPKSQHPLIDSNLCIGCHICTTVCPEGDVLAMLGGKAVIVNGYKCIGHSLCAEACPVGAITMVLAAPGLNADVPYLTPEYETSVSNLYIIGELGGLALIKNAVNQGRDCVQTIQTRIAADKCAPSGEDVFDVVIIGAGPAGISASLAAIQNKLKALTIEQDEIGGTVSKYPRQKLVMTSPVEFPMYGKFRKTELSKENLLAFWNTVLERVDFNVRVGEKTEDIKKDTDGVFTVITTKAQYRARSVILALGKTGTPRKLGVKGEELPKVMYRLIEADHYINKNILIVGGGDSAVEAAMGLARQQGNKVTLSYRQGTFNRIKDRNQKRIEECMRNKSVDVIFNSSPVEFTPAAVIMDVNGETREIPNDFAWVFAGGTPPNDFLKKVGVEFGMKDVTFEASREARSAELFRQSA